MTGGLRLTDFYRMTRNEMSSNFFASEFVIIQQFKVKINCQLRNVVQVPSRFIKT